MPPFYSRICKRGHCYNYNDSRRRRIRFYGYRYLYPADWIQISVSNLVDTDICIRTRLDTDICIHWIQISMRTVVEDSMRTGVVLCVKSHQNHVDGTQTNLGLQRCRVFADLAMSQGSRTKGKTHAQHYKP